MLKETYKKCFELLKAAEFETADLEARWIIEHRTSYKWSDIIASPHMQISKSQEQQISEDLHLRLSGVPLSRIYGVREFWGMEFHLNEHTLDPRADTETLIECAIDLYKASPPQTILDLGTGSGCILIALLSEFPEAKGVGIDKSYQALSCAQMNAQYNNCTGRAHFTCGSWLESVQGRFDLIVSNPPYIAESVIPTLSREVQNHDPILALEGGKDGLMPYKIIFPQLKNYLKLGGRALFEIGYDQEKTIMRLAEDSGFFDMRIYPDLSGNPRVVEISCGDK